MLVTVLGALFAAYAVWLITPSVVSQRFREVFYAQTDDGDAFTNMAQRWRRKGGMDADQKQQLTRALRTLSAELRAGGTPVEALRRAAGDPVLWPHALAAAQFGEPVDAALVRDARSHPVIAGPLRQLAACWRVGVTRGAGLAVSIERLALSVRAQQELEATLRSELAAPRATGRMLALLPIVGMGMGYLLGANPLAWFLGSSAGILVLMCAVALTAVGGIWTRRIVHRVESALT